MKECKVGTVRIGTSDLLAYEKTKTSWKKSKYDISLALTVVDLFTAHKNFKELIDKKNPGFLKGQISKDDKIQGARLNILPNGNKITGTYSLFSKHITIHSEDSHDHWDVIYKNPSGYCYLYDKEKIKKHNDKKYSKVKHFEKLYPELNKKIAESLKDKDDYMAVPVYTLLKTYMRIGNEIYYKAHKHRGLTTLSKENVKIKGKMVTFNFTAKDGIPMTIEEEFPETYIKRLKPLLKNSPYIFQSPTGKALTEIHFKRAFKKYTGKEFYPHIVRSFFATHETKEFLKHHKKATKKEIQEFLLHVANKLGHRKFNKKKNVWQESYAVTIHHYIAPNLMKRLNKIVK